MFQYRISERFSHTARWIWIFRIVEYAAPLASTPFNQTCRCTWSSVGSDMPQNDLRSCTLNVIGPEERLFATRMRFKIVIGFLFVLELLAKALPAKFAGV